MKKTSKSNAATNPVTVEKPLDPRKEHITDEELNRIKTLQSKAVYAATLAEKAYSEARVAELEVNNFTLIVYNKYRLVSGKDSITNDGLIIRIEETTQEV
jgi:hypothetical protein